MKTMFVLATIASLAVPVKEEAQPQPSHGIDPNFCQELVEYKPAPDVAYQPGVDVHGKPVVESDLNPSPVKVPDTISFDVTVDLARNLGIPSPAGLEAETKIGTITFDKGVLSYNGEPMGGPAAAALREACTNKVPVKTAVPVKHNKD